MPSLPQSNKLILLSGKQGSGKTTASYNLKNWAIGNRWRFKDFKFADPLYEMHDLILGVLKKYGIKTPHKDGPLLQMLGTDWARKNYGPDIWASLGRARVEIELERSSLDHPTLFVVDDCRFMNELEYFDDAFKVRLECNRDERKARADAWRDNENHPSETQFDGKDLTKLFHRVFFTDKGHCTPEMIVKSLEEEYLLK